MKPRVLKSQSPEFKKFLVAILERRGGDSGDIDSAVSKIIADVRKRGDRALIELTAKFDHVKLTEKTLRVTPAERHSAINHIPPEDRRALELAAERIAEFHRRTMEKSFIYRD
ncbi:MAG TPA: histidinol dehydrogenase, partial [Candidatus Binatus sp.]|nr:histidinol dehydrogenase [Candidatus Binatus sp.]